MGYGPNDYDDIDYESIEDIARSEGFNIDDDGHWVPMEDTMEYEDFSYDVDSGGDFDVDFD